MIDENRCISICCMFILQYILALNVYLHKLFISSSYIFIFRYINQEVETWHPLPNYLSGEFEVSPPTMMNKLLASVSPSPLLLVPMVVVSYILLLYIL